MLMHRIKTRAIRAQLVLLLAVIANYNAVQLAVAAENDSIRSSCYIYMLTVDTKRMVIAIDENKDETFEQIFLYVSSNSLNPQLNWLRVPGRIAYQSGILLIATTDGDARTVEFAAPGNPSPVTKDDTIRFDKTAGLKQYVPAVSVRVADLEILAKQVNHARLREQTVGCDATPQTCLELAGHYLPFPR